jgi:hypothetical protein
MRRRLGSPRDFGQLAWPGRRSTRRLGCVRRIRWRWRDAEGSGPVRWRYRRHPGTVRNGCGAPLQPGGRSPGNIESCGGGNRLGRGKQEQGCPTVCPTQERRSANLLNEWCPGAESNHRHCDFQSHALPTELPGPCDDGRRGSGLIESDLRVVQPSRYEDGRPFQIYVMARCRRPAQCDDVSRRALARTFRRAGRVAAAATSII